MTTISHVAETTHEETHIPGEKSKLWRHIGGYTGRILLCLVFGLPLVFLIVSCFKTDDADLRRPDLGQGVPPGRQHVTGQLHRRVRPGPVLDLHDELRPHLGHSPWWSASSSTRMAAFALARLKFKGQKVIFGVILATLIVPFETLALPLLWWVNKLPWLDANGFSTGWLDTYEVQIIPFIANAFSIYLFYQYFDSIPQGTGRGGRGRRRGLVPDLPKIIMPLSGPAIATVAILTFLPGLERIPVAVDGRADGEPPSGDGRHRLLQAAQHLLGADHGLRHNDHRPGVGVVHRLPAVVHQFDRLFRSEGLKVMFAPAGFLGVGLLARRRLGSTTTCSSCTPRRRCPIPSAGTSGPPSGHAIVHGSGDWTRVRDALVRDDGPAFDDVATWTGSVIRAPDGTWLHVLHRRQHDRARLRPDRGLRHLTRPDALDQAPSAIRWPGPTASGTRPSRTANGTTRPSATRGSSRIRKAPGGTC